MIAVENKVTVWEVDGKEQSVPMPTISVVSHWNRDSLVVLDVEGRKLAVSARDLLAAIANATNIARHG